MASSEEVITRYLLLGRLEGWNWQKVEDEFESQFEPASQYLIAYTPVPADNSLLERLELARIIWGKMDLAVNF